MSSPADELLEYVYIHASSPFWICGLLKVPFETFSIRAVVGMLQYSDWVYLSQPDKYICSELYGDEALKSDHKIQLVYPMNITQPNVWGLQKLIHRCFFYLVRADPAEHPTVLIFDPEWWNQKHLVDAIKEVIIFCFEELRIPRLLVLNRNRWNQTRIKESPGKLEDLFNQEILIAEEYPQKFGEQWIQITKLNLA